MLHPPCDVLPGLVDFPFLAFGHDFGRPCDVLLLDDSLAHRVITLNLLRIITGHRDHFEGLLVLSLPPLVEGLCAISPPEHQSQLIATFVLATSQLLVTGELANVLEAALPH